MSTAYEAQQALFAADSFLGEALGELSEARDRLEESGPEFRQTMLAIDMTVSALIRRRNIVGKLHSDVERLA